MWTRADRMVMRALEAHERSLCSGCGQPRHRSMNPGMGGEYQIRKQVCASCSALENSRKGSESTPGVKDFVVDAGPQDEDLPVWNLDLRPLTEDDDFD